jgi:predicted TIM-barrel fold metal-dependent hydrolase
MPLIDTNVHLSRWPFRRVANDIAPALVAKLKRLGITEAWAGSYDALLHRDLSAVNERLVTDCRRHGAGFLRPFGCVNPSLPDWEEDLRRCAEVYKMKGVRLYPNYHQYDLAAVRFKKLFAMATERGLLVQIAVMMEDERTQHPLVSVPHVNTAPLIDLLKQTPKARVMLLNCFRAVRGGLLLKLHATRRVWFDLATLEGMAGIGRLLKLLPADRLVFGTGAPFYIPESAALKLKESKMTQAQFDAITFKNAQAL